MAPLRYISALLVLGCSSAPHVIVVHVPSKCVCQLPKPKAEEAEVKPRKKKRSSALSQTNLENPYTKKEVPPPPPPAAAFPATPPAAQAGDD